ncbi:MAG: PAAR domain-containing protein [Paraburkholderia sp.]|jgi:uncharacterized Zn-binding protein involved in type VI secretion|nr:PAAR domain-containing protein [Paraburkholderia sp.]
MKAAVSGREVTRPCDTIEHGGAVIETAPNLTHQGIPVALDGHMIRCPKYGGDFAIVATQKRTHSAVHVAFIGDKTTCGAALRQVA